MDVNVSWPNADELSFSFQVDATDAAVPLSVVWFRCNGVNRVAPLRTGLMAYLLAKPFIGNSFTLTGHPLAAHLATRLYQDFQGHEFFVGPVTNVPDKIVPNFQYDAMDVCSDGWSKPTVAALLTCRRHELGYVFERSGDEIPLLSIATNVDLFSAFTEQPSLLSLLLIYLCSYDILGVRRIRVRTDEESHWLKRANVLLTEVGGRASLETKRSLHE